MKPRHWLLAATLASVAACDLVLGPDRVPGALAVVDGDAQVDTVGAALAGELVVEVRDEEGATLPGAAVVWAVAEGEATVTPRARRTGEDGTVSADVRLGTVAGAVTVEARIEGLAPAVFELTALPDEGVAVRPSPEAVEMDALGDSVRVEAEVVDRYGNAIPDAEVTWSTTDDAVVDVRPDGLVRGLAPGTATVTARSDTAAAAVPVTIRQAPESAAIAPAEPLLTAIDDTAPLTATAYDRNGHAIDGVAFDWSSGDPDVVAVSAAGVATAMAPGEAAITAVAGEVSATATARVEQEVASVVLAAPPDTLRSPGDTLRVTASARDRNGHEVEGASFTWSSNRTSVATVDGTGLVTAGSGRGDARISAAADGVEGRRTVTRIPFGVLVLTFDDAFEDVYTRVFPLLEQHGLLANIALPTGWLGRSGHLTESQVRELHAAGWSILPHTVDHPDLTTVSDAEVDRQLRESRQWVRDQGFRGSEVFVVPFHRWFEDEQEAVRNHFVAARGWGIDHERNGGMVDWPATDPFMLTSIPGGRYFETADGRQQMEDWWAEAVSTGKFVGTFFHSIGADDVAALEDVIERLVRYRDHLRTYADLFE